MKFSRLLVATILLNTTFFALAQNAENFDILGVKLGMTKEQAEATLKSQLPNASIDSTEFYRESPGIPKSLAKIKYSYTNNESETSWISLGFLPLSGKIFSISRQEKIGARYKPETWTAFDNLQAAFEKKYGAPTFTSKFGTPPASYIVFDKNMKRTKTEPCMGVVIGSALFRQTDDRCGIELGYQWRQGEDRKFIGLASGLEVALNNYAMINSEIKLINLKSAEIQKQQREQGSRNNSPKL